MFLWPHEEMLMSSVVLPAPRRGARDLRRPLTSTPGRGPVPARVSGGGCGGGRGGVGG